MTALKWRVRSYPGFRFRWLATHPREGTKAFRTWGEAMLFAMTEADKARDLDRLRRLHFRTVIRHG